MVAPNPALSTFVRTLPLFAHVADEQLLEVLRLLHPAPLKTGEVLFREDEPGTAMWLLGEGVEVAVSRSAGAPSGRVVLAYVGAGQTLGEMSLVDSQLRSGSARVVQGGLAHRVNAADFLALRMGRRPVAYQVLRGLCQELCGKLRATSDRIASSQGPRAGLSPPGPGVRPDPEVLEELPLLRPLPKVVKLALAQKFTLLELPEVCPLFREGEEGDATYLILSGEVAVGRNGRTLAQLGPGSFFGQVAAIDGGRRSASCLTSGPTRLLRLSRQDFNALFRSGNRFAYYLVDQIARQLVEHLRHANALLSSGGSARGPLEGLPFQVPALTEEELLPEAQVLPLELEIDLDDEPLA